MVSDLAIRVGFRLYPYLDQIVRFATMRDTEVIDTELLSAAIRRACRDEYGILTPATYD